MGNRPIRLRTAESPQIVLQKEFPVELRVPNSLTAETLEKSDRNEEIEHFESVQELYASWEDDE